MLQRVLLQVSSFCGFTPDFGQLAHISVVNTNSMATLTIAIAFYYLHNPYLLSVLMTKTGQIELRRTLIHCDCFFHYIKYLHLLNPCIKVPGDVAVKEADSKDSASDLLNEAKPREDDQEKSVVKRDLHLSLENKLEILKNDNVVSHNSGNQTHLQDKEVSRQVSKDLPESREHSLEKHSKSNNSNPLVDESPKAEESIKIRDLKSKIRASVRQTSALSSRSIRSFLSKPKTKLSRRSKLQVSEHLLCQVLLTNINVVSRTAGRIF